MRPFVIDIDPSDEDTNGFANDVTAASGAAFTLITDETPDGLAHKVVITPSGSVTGSYTISGKNADDVDTTETLATDTTNAVTSVNYYKSDIVVLAPSGLGAETVDIGWADEVASQTVPLDWVEPSAAYIGIDVAGTINFTVQETPSNVWEDTTPAWFSLTALASKTADTAALATIGVVAVRVILNSYSSGAELQAYITQPVHQ